MSFMMMEMKYMIYFSVILCTHAILTQNIINTCMKILHTHAIVSLAFMDFGFNLEVVLYQICMRDTLWVWGCCDNHIWCITFEFHVHNLYGLKSKKLMCEKLAFPCGHWITSFHDFGFNLGGVLYHICGRVFLWFLCCWGRNFYSIYYHHVSYYS